MEPANGMRLSDCSVAEMYKYSTDLKSMTQSRADFTMTFSSYEEVPASYRSDHQRI